MFYFVWILHPPAPYFPLKILTFETPLPIGISNEHPYGGYGYFLKSHVLQSHIWQFGKLALKWCIKKASVLIHVPGAGTVLKIPHADDGQPEVFVPVIPVASLDSMVNSSSENSSTAKPNIYRLKYRIAYILVFANNGPKIIEGGSRFFMNIP